MTNVDNSVRVLGRNIAYLRDKHGLTQAQMAKKLRVKPESLSMLEMGELSPDISVRLLQDIYNIFGVSIPKQFTPLYDVAWRDKGGTI